VAGVALLTDVDRVQSEAVFGIGQVRLGDLPLGLWRLFRADERF